MGSRRRFDDVIVIYRHHFLHIRIIIRLFRTASSASLSIVDDASAASAASEASRARSRQGSREGRRQRRSQVRAFSISRPGDVTSGPGHAAARAHRRGSAAPGPTAAAACSPSSAAHACFVLHR